MRKLQNLILWVVGAALLMALAAGSALFTIRLLVQAPDAVGAPDVQRMFVDEALERASAAGLNLRSDGKETHSGLAEGIVIRQKPLPGEPMREGGTIHVIVSAGAGRVPVPDVSGIHFEQAREIMQRNRLSVEELVHVRTREHLKGRVIASDPAAGEAVAPNHAVALLVAGERLPLAWVTPELVGHELEHAVDLLEAAGAAPPRIEERYDATRAVETILAQTPAPGSRLTEDEPMRLTVNRQPAVAPTAARLTPLRVAIPPGFSRRRLQVRVEDRGRISIAFDDYLEPGTVHRQAVFTLGPARIEVLLDGERIQIKEIGKQ